MAGRVDGKVAVITGAGSGIGRATALAFTREGAKVVVADIVVTGGDETVRMIKAAGGEAIFIKTDVTKAAEVEALIKQTVETYGRLDCAFNNAGIEGEIAPTADCTEENWDRVVNVDLKSVWLCLKYEIPQMLKQGGGAIVNTASVYAKAGIRVNAVCPGVIRTPMVERAFGASPQMAEAAAAMEPVGRLGKPEEIAEAVLWLCSDAASFVTGLPMAVDGA